MATVCSGNNISLGIVFHFGRHVQPRATRNIFRPTLFRSPNKQYEFPKHQNTMLKLGTVTGITGGG
jgi:hypothetical protein